MNFVCTVIVETSGTIWDTVMMRSTTSMSPSKIPTLTMDDSRDDPRSKADASGKTTLLRSFNRLHETLGQAEAHILDNP